MTTPDRATARRTERVGKRITEQDVVDLLIIGRRLERVAVKRMVRVELERMRSGAFSVTNANNDYYWRLGYKRACSNILAALATREKR